MGLAISWWLRGERLEVAGSPEDESLGPRGCVPPLWVAVACGGKDARGVHGDHRQVTHYGSVCHVYLLLRWASAGGEVYLVAPLFRYDVCQRGYADLEFGCIWR